MCHSCIVVLMKFGSFSSQLANKQARKQKALHAGKQARKHASKHQSKESKQASKHAAKQSRRTSKTGMKDNLSFLSQCSNAIFSAVELLVLWHHRSKKASKHDFFETTIPMPMPMRIPTSYSHFYVSLFLVPFLLLVGVLSWYYR